MYKFQIYYSKFSSPKDYGDYHNDQNSSQNYNVILIKIKIKPKE